MNPTYEHFPLYSKRTSLCYTLAYDTYLSLPGSMNFGVFFFRLLR